MKIPDILNPARDLDSQKKYDELSELEDQKVTEEELKEIKWEGTKDATIRIMRGAIAGLIIGTGIYLITDDSRPIIPVGLLGGVVDYSQYFIRTMRKSKEEK